MINKLMSFNEAVEQLKKGERLMRQGWTGDNTWLIYIESDAYDLKAWKHFNATEQLPFIAIKTSDNKIAPWSEDQTDVSASDWQTM